MVLLAFVLYFVLVIAIGFFFYKKSSGMSDYFLGGRKMNPYVTALSAQASDMSSWLLMGLPASIVVGGLSNMWIGIGLAIGSYCAWLFAAKRIRKHSVVSGNALTMTEFISNRFKDEKGHLRLICSVIVLMFFIPYVASGFVGCGEILTTIFPNLGFSIAMCIGGLVIVIYTFTGGYKAVCWTDFFQALLMLFAVVIVPIVTLGYLSGPEHIGGWAEISGLLGTISDDFMSVVPSGEGLVPFIAIVSSLAWGLGYFGMPHIIVRYMSIRDPEEVKVARRVSLIWIVIALTAVLFIGLLGRAYIMDMNGGTSLDGYDPQRIFLDLAGGLFPALVAGLLYAAVMAAIMSTADSQLLVSASSITNDILAKRKGSRYTDGKLMWVSRGVVIAVAVIALIWALVSRDSIMNLVSYAWAGFGAAFGPLVILSLYWKRMNYKGAMASLVVGFITVILWHQFLAASTGLYEIVPGFLFSLIAGVVVSLLTEPPSEDMVREFDEAQTYVEPADE